jgi:hypothetical protein
MSGSEGHRIFVPLSGITKIMLCESGIDGACADVEGFQVIDANGTDGSARFALPNPDPENDLTTTYSVFARALGSPKDNPYANMTTCAYEKITNENGEQVPGELYCSYNTLTLRRQKGQSVFTNVSRDLLYIWYDIDLDGDYEHFNLFNTDLMDYFWQYDNNKLRHAQLRFYPCETTITVVDPLDPTKNTIDDSACFEK